MSSGFGLHSELAKILFEMLTDNNKDLKIKKGDEFKFTVNLRFDAETGKMSMFAPCLTKENL